MYERNEYIVAWMQHNYTGAPEYDVGAPAEPFDSVEEARKWIEDCILEDKAGDDETEETWDPDEMWARTEGRHCTCVYTIIRLKDQDPSWKKKGNNQ